MAEDGNNNWGNFGGNEADGNDSEPSAVLNDTAEMSLSFASFAGDPNSTESAENVNAETGAADGTTDAPIDLDWGNTGEIVPPPACLTRELRGLILFCADLHLYL